jgi:uncharacterized protein
MPPLIICVPTASRRAAYDFYRTAGFETAGDYVGGDGVPEPLQVVINEGARVMLIPTTGFGWVTAGRPAAEPGTSECVLSVLVESEAEVRDLLERARTAGGGVPVEPAEQPWGYAGAFTDPDGHLWMVQTRSATAPRP